MSLGISLRKGRLEIGQELIIAVGAGVNFSMFERSRENAILLGAIDHIFYVFVMQWKTELNSLVGMKSSEDLKAAVEPFSSAHLWIYLFMAQSELHFEY